MRERERESLRRQRLFCIGGLVIQRHELFLERRHEKQAASRNGWAVALFPNVLF